MRKCIIILVALLAMPAVALSAPRCLFNTASATLSFGNLDPGIGADVTVSTNITVRCVGAASITFSLSDDDGLYESGPDLNRMRNTTVASEYLPYNLSISPISGTVPNNTNTNIAITATVKGIDIQNAYVGSYADTVTITVVP